MVLRPLEERDAYTAVALYQEGVEWLPYTAVAIPQGVAAAALGAPDAVWYVAVEEDGRVVGLAGFERIRWVDRVGEPGIALTREARGKGLAHPILAALVRMGIKHLNLRRLQTIVVAGGPGEAMLIKEGFTREGVLKGMRHKDGEYVDGCMYALVVEECK